jgi:hypothetical protein
VRPFVRRLGNAVTGIEAGELPAVGIPGVTAAAQPAEWDAVESARASELVGNEVHFVALADSALTVIVDEDEPDGSVAPLADAIESQIEPPYRAVALRQSDDVWSVAALRVQVVELPAGIDGDAIELTSVDGDVVLRIDDRDSDLELAALEEIGDRLESDYAVRAERLTETTWVVDADAL